MLASLLPSRPCRAYRHLCGRVESGMNQPPAAEGRRHPTTAVGEGARVPPWRRCCRPDQLRFNHYDDARGLGAVVVVEHITFLLL
jgi:hypothetical protein